MRRQATLIELVEPAPPGEPALFRTAVVMGEDGELTYEPQFEVLREPAGALVVRGRDRDTPWQELARVSVPASTRVQPQMPPWPSVGPTSPAWGRGDARSFPQEFAARSHGRAC